MINTPHWGIISDKTVVKKEVQMINSKTSETNRNTFTQKSTNKVKLSLLLRVIHLKTYKLLRDVLKCICKYLHRL